jgi:programmed cell death 8 (apoptosis-inducing factor)
VVFFLSREERRVVGVLTWNLFGKMDIARKVIAEGKKEGEIGGLMSQFGLEPPPKPQPQQ